MASASASFHRTISPPLQPRRRGPSPPRCTHSERGVSFDPGSAFYCSDSAPGRDLAVLAATLHRRGRPEPSAPFLCLDAMCGCGVRALRYLAQVWANDASDALRPVVVGNLSRFEPAPPEGNRRWVVSHLDATRLLAERYLRREYFDVIDVDSFGSEAEYIRAAFLALKNGGLLYLTSTGWRSARGYGGKCSLSLYGAYVRPVPYPNEIGLRMLIGGAAREAAMLGFHIRPVFSYYAYHGPIFRAMVQLCNGKEDSIGNYGFICHCKSCGQTQTFGFDELGQISCGCADRTDANSITVVGPLWTGPLHDAPSITEMLSLAAEWEWAHTSESGVTLEKLLDTMIEESDPRLPPGYIRLDEIASRVKVNSPPLGTLINSLRKEGYAACRSHIAANAIKDQLSHQFLYEVHTGDPKFAMTANYTPCSWQLHKICNVKHNKLWLCDEQSFKVTGEHRIPKPEESSDIGSSLEVEQLSSSTAEAENFALYFCIWVSHALQCSRYAFVLIHLDFMQTVEFIFFFFFFVLRRLEPLLEGNG